ncbi:MAG: hypothetical protein H6644_03435 [Caldilineaceae bacterium]|nr:hypothetical protein [Caldilineaceae bacterium]
MFADTDHAHRFYLPAGARWRTVPDPDTAGAPAHQTTARYIARESDLLGIIDQRDFNATEGNQRVLNGDNSLKRLVNTSSSRRRLGLNDVQQTCWAAPAITSSASLPGRGSSAGRVLRHRRGLCDCPILDPGRATPSTTRPPVPFNLGIKTQLRRAGRSWLARWASP